MKPLAVQGKAVRSFAKWFNGVLGRDPARRCFDRAPAHASDSIVWVSVALWRASLSQTPGGIKGKGSDIGVPLVLSAAVLVIGFFKDSMTSTNLDSCPCSKTLGTGPQGLLQPGVCQDFQVQRIDPAVGVEIAGSRLAQVGIGFGEPRKIAHLQIRQGTPVEAELV